MGSKEYMSTDEIRDKVLSNYPYKVYEIIPIKFKDTSKQRAVYRFESDDGPKCLKKVYFDEGNLLFVYSVIQWFFYRGINVPRVLPTKYGGRYVKYKGDLFFVTDWVEGRKCDYDLDGDIEKAAENLGRMHRCSYGFKPIEGSFIRKDEYNWYETFHRRHMQLLQFYNTASRSKDKFSRLFLKSFDYYQSRAQHAVSILSTIDDRELEKYIQKYNTICHLDYVNKNLIFTYSGELYIIDFDKSKIDTPIHDIGTFLKRILKRKNTSWDYNVLILTIENYEKERKLTQSEFLGLFSYLEFPQKYWKISRNYYNNRKEYDKKTLLSMLSKTCSQLEDHNEFCNKFQDYIENRFKISL